MSLSKKRTNRKYDLAFKEDVIKMIAAGRPIPEVSTSLGITASLLHRWYKASQLLPTNSSPRSTPLTALKDNSQEEIERLRSELRRTEQERDILKKALGIFSRGI